MQANSLEKQFRDSYPQFAELLVEESNGRMDVNSSDNQVRFRINNTDREWTMYSNEAHAHFEDFDEALEVLAKLLTGRARGAVQYRSDTVAAAWFEVFDGEYWEQIQSAVYLSPFDPAEWCVWPGDRWRQVRTTYSTDLESGLMSSVLKERPLADEEVKPPIQNWLAKGLGPPIDGLVWVPGFDSGSVIQKPEGWRMTRQERSVLFSSVGGMMHLRVWGFFSDPSAPKRNLVEAARPSRVDRFPAGSPGKGDRSWNIYFLDNTTVVALELSYRPEVKVEGEAIAGLLDQAAELALIVPPDWDCRYDPQG